MEIVITPELAILVVLILLSAFIALYFFFGQDTKQLSNNILGLFFLDAGFDFLMYLLKFQEIIDVRTSNLVDFALFGIGNNLLYFYTKSILVERYRLLSEHVTHILPLFMGILLSLGLLIWYDKFGDLLTQISFFLGILMTIIYLAYSLVLIRKYEVSVKNAFSSPLWHRVGWLKFIIYLTIIFYVFPITWGFFERFTQINPDVQVMRMFAGTITITYFLIILWKVLTFASKTRQIPKSEFRNRETINALSSSQEEEILRELKDYFRNEQPFLNSDISLKQLSEHMGISARQISQAINNKGQNFYEYINSYRIEYAKEQLQTKSKAESTISEIMYSAGFNSKSSFHTAFKKSTGMTPSEYRKSTILV